MENGQIVFNLDMWQLIQLGLSVVLPAIVGLVTTRFTNSKWKTWILAGLSLVTSLGTEAANAWHNGDTYNLGMALILGVVTLVLGSSVHQGVLKPLGVSAKLQNVGANVGKHAVGTASPLPTDNLGNPIEDPTIPNVLDEDMDQETTGDDVPADVSDEAPLLSSEEDAK